MKVKPTPKRGRVLVEVDRKDEALLSGSQPAESWPFALRKILVPVDFSDCSRKAVQYAQALARQFDARLILLNVMPTNYFVGSEFGPVEFPVPQAEWRTHCLRELETFATQELPSTKPFQTLVREGQPAHEIAACAGALEVDLIVIATHGRTGLRHVLLGSVAENVVRYSPCPVLVVREHGHEFLRSSPSTP